MTRATEEEAEHMTWQTKLVDIEYYAEQKGRAEGRRVYGVENERRCRIRETLGPSHLFSETGP